MANSSQGSFEDRFSVLLGRIRERAGSGGLTLRELLEVFGPKGHVFLTIFLVIPFLQPIPLPGISTVVGLTIAFVGFFMMINRPPWIPARFAKIKLEGKLLIRFCSGVEYLMRRLETWIKPRCRELLRRRWFGRVNGAVLFFHGIVLSLPLPIPFSNFLPALVLMLIALGALEEDILLVIAGYIAVIVNAAYYVALVVIPYLSVQALKT